MYCLLYGIAKRFTAAQYGICLQPGNVEFFKRIGSFSSIGEELTADALIRDG